MTIFYIKITDILENRFRDGIDNSRVFLSFLAPKYLESKNCNIELSYAHEKNKKIIPIYIKKCESSNWPAALVDIKNYLEPILFARFYRLKENDLKEENLKKQLIFYQVVYSLTNIMLD